MTRGIGSHVYNSLMDEGLQKQGVAILSAGCDCDRCQYNRQVQQHLAALSDEQRPFFEEMYERLFYTQNDLDHANVILDGSWPSAVPQLERALVEARRIASERGYDRAWITETPEPGGYNDKS